MAPMGTTLTGLETAVAQLLSNAQQNRTPLEAKWLDNYTAFTCDETRDRKTWKKSEARQTWQSTTYFDITRQKITAAVSLTRDVLFKGGRVPFMLSPEQRSPLVSSIDPLLVERAVEQNEERIHAQFDNCKAQSELKRMLIFGATYGEMWVKTFTTDMTESFWDAPETGLLAQVSRTSRSKAFEARSPWDLWWDAETDDAQQMAYIFERRMMTLSQLRGFIGRGQPFIDSALREAIQSAPKTDGSMTSGYVQASNSMAPGLREITYRQRPVEAFECWCRVPRDKAREFEAQVSGAPAPGIETDPMAAAAQADTLPPTAIDQELPLGADTAPFPPTEEPLDDNGESDLVDIFALLVGNRVVAYMRDPGPRPYAHEVWEENIDAVGGRGIADNLVHIQTTLNGAIRSFENNAKLIANLIVAVQRRLIQNKNLNDVIKEGGVIELDESVQNVKEAVQQLAFTDITGPLQSAIEMFMSFADLASNLPRAEQGQQSDNPQTAYELQQRLDKSGKYLASVISNIDRIIQWLAEQFYAYNASNPDLVELPKIPAVVKALGFTSFENRFLRVQRLMQMLTIALQNPTLEKLTNIRWLWEEIGKAQDLEADQFMRSMEEIEAELVREREAAMMQQQQAGATAPAPDAPEAQSRQALIEATIGEKAAKAEKDKATADRTRTQAAIELGRAQQLAAQNQAVIEAQRRTVSGLQVPG